ncbi:MAG: leucyl aminopeptidase [Candidatus Promineifilaceae bacterium]|nr:leucyl aminopeptidase [Candidatus Promineifilaceae bacterium]
MNVEITQGSIQESSADTIIVNLFDGVKAPGGATGAVDQALDGAISDLITNGDLRGRAGETAVIYPRGTIDTLRVIVIGLGDRDDFDLEAARHASAAAILKARQLGSKHVASIVHGAGIANLPVQEAAQATVEGALLALYQFNALKKPSEPNHEIERISIVEFHEEKLVQIKNGIEVARAVQAGVELARDLVNMPPNVATPTRIAAESKQFSKEYDLDITIGGRRWARERDMGAFLAVAKGAGEKPKFVVIEHNPSREDLDTIVLVGKGITFDTGGISIKPSLKMELMKSDMAGAAAVLGAMKAVAMLDLPLHVVAIAPLTENMPDANAYHPADVITASNGKTIEIISTDAEGRMILADALVYAQQYNPMAVVDLATLTGSCVVALGQGVAAGLFSNDDQLRDRLLAAAQETQERLWPLPLWEDYRKKMESPVADLKNSGGRMGGVGTSAAFLKEFTAYNWAHLDIAGMAMSEKDHGYVPRGATGFGVRLLVEFLRSWK